MTYEDKTRKLQLSNEDYYYLLDVKHFLDNLFDGRRPFMKSEEQTRNLVQRLLAGNRMDVPLVISKESENEK
jgi:hypothetical protein